MLGESCISVKTSQALGYQRKTSFSNLFVYPFWKKGYFEEIKQKCIFGSRLHNKQQSQEGDIADQRRRMAHSDI